MKYIADRWMKKKKKRNSFLDNRPVQLQLKIPDTSTIISRLNAVAGAAAASTFNKNQNIKSPIRLIVASNQMAERPNGISFIKCTIAVVVLFHSISRLHERRFVRYTSIHMHLYTVAIVHLHVTDRRTCELQ